MPIEWDENNEEHLVFHRITPTEVEEVFEGETVRQNRPTDAPDRVRFLGRTAAGRYLILVVQLKEGDVIRPITGWDMSPHERKVYGRQAKR